MNSLGRHILVEFFGCDPQVLNDVSKIENGMLEAAQRAKATVINSTFHHFSPWGVSGVVVIQESHLAIHTWPEYEYAAVDLFTCGDTVDPWISFDELKKVFRSKNHSAIEMYRGNLNLLNRSLDFAYDRKRGSVPVPKFTRTLWFTDRDENQALSLRYKGDCLFNEISPYQAVRVFETTAYGKMLTLDSAIMCTERDEPHYHEMLVHPAMQIHGNPAHVLIIGGGDGGTAREVLRYPSIEKVKLVEIDEVVVRASRTHFPNLSKAFENPKLELIFRDGVEYIRELPEKAFDVVLVDGADPVGPAEALFSEEFFWQCHRILRTRGILAVQGESPMFHEETFIATHHRLQRVFGKGRAHVALFFAPTYPSGMWSIQLAGNFEFNPLNTDHFKNMEDFAERHNLHYYDALTHQSAFSIPRFVRKMLEN